MRSNLVLSWVLVAVACGSTVSPSPAPAPAPTAATPATAPIAAVVVDASIPDAALVETPPDTAPDVPPVDVKASAAAALAKLTPEEAKLAKSYAVLLRAIASCPPGAEGSLDWNCKHRKPLLDAQDKYVLARGHDKASRRARWRDITHAAHWMHATTTSMMLRLYLIGRAVDYSGSRDPDLAAVVLTADASPQDLYLMMLDAGSGDHSIVSPALVKVLLARTSHADAKVRDMALSAVSHFTPPPPGVYGALVHAIDQDPATNVRIEACRYAGNSGDERMLAVYDRLLARTTDAVMFDSCAHGLVLMWTLADRPSEGAYRRSLHLFATGRHDTSMKDLWGTLAYWTEIRARDPRPWIQEADLRAAFETRILNVNSSEAGRIGAAMCFARLATDEQARALLAKLKGDSDPAAKCLDWVMRDRSHSCQGMIH